MQRYWDLSDRERGELTEQQMERYAAIELMEAGVLPAGELALVEEPAMPDADCTAYRLRVGYHTRELVFPTIDAAMKGASDALGILESSSYGSWPNAVSVSTLKPIRLSLTTDDTSTQVEKVAYYSDDLMSRARTAVEKAAAARAENTRLLKEHEDALKRQREATAGLWDDWHRCRAEADEMARIVRTLVDYERMADGDRNVAMKFLEKAFSRDKIETAVAWNTETATP